MITTAAVSPLWAAPMLMRQFLLSSTRPPLGGEPLLERLVSVRHIVGRRFASGGSRGAHDPAIWDTRSRCPADFDDHAAKAPGCHLERSW